MEEEEQIRKRAANETALSAIGSRRKRPAANSSESQVLTNFYTLMYKYFMLLKLLKLLVVISNWFFIRCTDWITGVLKYLIVLKY